MRAQLCAVVAMAAALGLTAPHAQERAAPTPLVARVADTGFIQLRADSFRRLDGRQQALAYWLTQASIAIDPIIYDQLSRFGIREKRLLEEIVARPDGIDADTFAKIRDYALLFWANRGNHNETTSQKFVPAFTPDALERAALAAQAHGAFKTPYADVPPLATPADVTRELTDLRPAIFEAAFEPMITAKTPRAGQDILQASSNTFYQGVTLESLKGFREHFPLNSRAVKGSDGTIREEVYRAGTPDGKVAAGVYAVYLKTAIGFLEK